jgi:hypothetical protein
MNARFHFISGIPVVIRVTRADFVFNDFDFNFSFRNFRRLPFAETLNVPVSVRQGTQAYNSRKKHNFDEGLNN